MKHGNIETLVAEVLEQLQKMGVQKKPLKDYKYCGFGSIVTHFLAQGKSDYSKAEAENYMEQVRERYEKGKISPWKWRQIRKSVALLEEFYVSGTLTLTPLPKWEVLHNPLHQKPSGEQLLDNEDIFALVYLTKQELTQFGLRQKSIENYTHDGFDAILRYFMQRGIKKYSECELRNLAAEARSKYENHRICRSAYQTIRKAAAMVSEYHDTGKLEWHYLPAWNTKELTSLFSHVLDAYCETNRRNRTLADGTIATSRSAIRQFLFCMEDMGIYDFSTVTRRMVSDCIPLLAPRYPAGMKSFIAAVRSFLTYVDDLGLSIEELHSSIPETAAPRRAIRSGFYPNEIEQLLLAVDRTTVVGKRDYAMMMLAVQTGLRVIDISNLTFQDIDWHESEIRVIQHKTGKPLCMPMEPETGNAIADYILNARPQCDCPYIFLSKDSPFRKLHNRSASSIAWRYMQKSEIDCTRIPRRGFHSFRRSFGAKLLESETPLEMLSEMLGHSSIDSSKPYVAVDEAGLRSCAIGLSGIEVKAGELK